MWRIRRLAVVGALLALLGCSGASTPPTDSPDAAAAPGPLSLSLLVFNVEYGGTGASDAVIRALDADVVAVLESYNRLPEIAEAAGYPYYNVGLQILSRYPILEPSGADGLYAWIEVRPGEAVALLNTHLDYVQDGPDRLARGVPLERVLATEREVRLSSVEKLMPSVTRLLDDGWPVLFTGDLNQPSHLDDDVAWPVSLALADAGLRDAYRERHPDAEADPGPTWGGVGGSAGSPRRIDYAYVGGPVQVGSSELVGERGVEGVDRGFARWTSDHRAVLTRLRLTPQRIPTTVALSSRMLTAGDEVTVHVRMPTGAGTVELRGPTEATYDVTGPAGTVTVDTGELAPGRYDVALRAGGEVLASNLLEVRPRNAQVALTTDRRTYSVGDPVTLRWTDGPANRWDWVGVFRAVATDPETDDYTVWGYTGGHDAGALPPSTTGEMVLGRDTQGGPWPLPPGRYVAHYLLTDQYAVAGSVRFRVR